MPQPAAELECLLLRSVIDRGWLIHCGFRVNICFRQAGLFIYTLAADSWEIDNVHHCILQKFSSELICYQRFPTSELTSYLSNSWHSLCQRSIMQRNGVSFIYISRGYIMLNGSANKAVIAVSSSYQWHNNGYWTLREIIGAYRMPSMWHLFFKFVCGSMVRWISYCSKGISEF